MLITAPRRLFDRIEDTPGSYARALVMLLTLSGCLAYLQFQTGLLERRIDQQTQERLAEFERGSGIGMDRAQFKTTSDAIRQSGTFNKTLTRLLVIVGTPVGLLGALLLLTAVLYAAVALSGRKPEFHTLLAIAVYSAFMDILAAGLTLAMMVYYRSAAVNTSLSGAATLLVPEAAPDGWLASALSALDPFRLWFWVLVGCGLVTTRQLGRGAALAGCTVLAVGSVGVRLAIARM